jgi:hypothetical protein
MFSTRIEARLYENGRNHKKHIRHKEVTAVVGKKEEPPRPSATPPCCDARRGTFPPGDGAE